MSFIQQFNMNKGNVNNITVGSAPRSSLKLQMAILTCPERSAALQQTLDSLRQSDWNAEPIIHVDQGTGSDPQTRQLNASFELLTRANKIDCDYLLFAEDDVIFNKFIRHNVLNWQPVHYGFCLVGTLYASTTGDNPTANYREMQPGGIGGSQGILIKKCWLPQVLNKWDSMHKTWLQDIRIYRSLYGSGQRVLVHTPSLVQHGQEVSTWGGLPHSSPDFDPAYKANSLE